MTEGENGSLGQEKPVNIEAIESISAPQTLGQRLKEGAISFAKDFRGTSLRLLIPISVSTAVGTTLVMNNVDQEKATLIGLGSAVTIIVAGEVRFWRHVSNRLPWFKVRYLDDHPLRNRDKYS